jgi:hypothetical protein
MCKTAARGLSERQRRGAACPILAGERTLPLSESETKPDREKSSLIRIPLVDRRSDPGRSAKPDDEGEVKFSNHWRGVKLTSQKPGGVLGISSRTDR